MPYVILAKDKPNGFDLRAEIRPAHLDYLKEQDAILMAAGPFVDDEDRMVGSMLIVDVATEADAKRFAENDPFAKAGLFVSSEIRKWRWGVKPPKAA
jgi:uncharacterized protein YciI